MRVNYLKEIVEFEKWVEENTLPTVAQLLWYKLMGRCNRMMWPEWFAIDNLRLMSMLHVSKETFRKAREALVAAGRIEVRPGKKGSPSQYRIIPFSSAPASKPNFFAENKAEKKGQKCPTLKNKKQIKKRDAVASPEKDTGAAEKSEELVKDAEAIRDLYNQICKSFPHLDKLSWLQRRAVKARLKEGRTVADFQKLFRNAEASDFLKGAGASGWKASLDWLLRRENMDKVLAGSYAVLYRAAEAREKKPKPNGFCNFEQRQTDYNALVMQSVLAWANA